MTDYYFFMSISNNKFKKLIIILGLTASGKTEMAIKLAKKFNGEIVSADSRQIYKEMDIGTDKPLKNQNLKISAFGGSAKDGKTQNRNSKLKTKKIEKLFIVKNIPHYLIDIINPDEDFSLAKYKKLAVEIIRDIQKRKKIPFLVGGTGLYISSIVGNLEIPKVRPDKSIRKELETESAEYLFKKLKKLDLKAAENIGSKNKRKLIRALEVCLITKKTFSSQQGRGEPLFDFLQIGVKIPREKLYKKINQRVDRMIEMGLEKEVKNLISKGYGLDLPSMSGLGYKQIGKYLKNKTSTFNKVLDKTAFQEAVESIKSETRHYAKRQMTWFKRDKRIKWVKNYSEAEKIVEKFL
jgi:tRNA dimethylallyltransferase